MNSRKERDEGKETDTVRMEGEWLHAEEISKNRQSECKLTK